MAKVSADEYFLSIGMDKMESKHAFDKHVELQFLYYFLIHGIIIVIIVLAVKKECVVRYADVGFILDGSGSVDQNQWEKVRK